MGVVKSQDGCSAAYHFPREPRQIERDQGVVQCSAVQ